MHFHLFHAGALLLQDQTNDWVIRHLVLMGDLLHVFTDYKSARSFEAVNESDVQPERTLKLNVSTRIESVSDMDNLEYVFHIFDSDHSMYLAAENLERLLKWISILTEEVENLQSGTANRASGATCDKPLKPSIKRSFTVSPSVKLGEAPEIIRQKSACDCKVFVDTETENSEYINCGLPDQFKTEEIISVQNIEAISESLFKSESSEGTVNASNPLDESASEVSKLGVKICDDQIVHDKSASENKVSSSKDNLILRMGNDTFTESALKIWQDLESKRRDEEEKIKVEKHKQTAELNVSESANKISENEEHKRIEEFLLNEERERARLQEIAETQRQIIEKQLKLEEARLKKEEEKKLAWIEAVKKRNAQDEEAKELELWTRESLGTQFVKHGRWGAPHTRLVSLRNGTVSWFTGDLPVKEIISVTSGKKTKVFERTEVEADVCFSIITKDRTLDLQAANKNQRDFWVKNINKLLE